MVGAELRLAEPQPRLVERARLRGASRALVGGGEVVAAGKRVGVVNAELRFLGLRLDAQAVVRPPQGVEQGPFRRPRARELLLEPGRGLVEHVGHLHVLAVDVRVGLL